MVAIAEQNGKPGDIYRLIPEIMREIGAVTKSRKNQQQGYSFRGIDDLYKACQPVLVEKGVFVVPEVLTEAREERQTKNGGMLIYTTLKVRHTFYASDGSHVTATTVGEAMDSGDKSSNKAMSSAMKYALIETFSIPTEEGIDTENDSPAPAPRQQARPPQRQATPPPRNMNPATGEVPANGAEKTVPVDPAAFAEYGDVMDDERFQEAVLNEMKKRSFTDKACIDAQASACRAEKVVGLGGFTLKRRHEFLMAIGAGFFDRFNVPQTNKATNRPARAAAGK